MPTELATPDLLKGKVFWNKGFEWIIYIHDSTIKISSRFSDVSKFWLFSIFMREVVVSQIIYGFVQKADF